MLDFQEFNDNFPLAMSLIRELWHNLNTFRTSPAPADKLADEVFCYNLLTLMGICSFNQTGNAMPDFNCETNGVQKLAKPSLKRKWIMTLIEMIENMTGASRGSAVIALVIALNLETWKDFDATVEVIEGTGNEKVFKAFMEATTAHENDYADCQHKSAVGRLLISLALFSW